MLQKMVRYLFLSEFWDMGWLLSVAMVVVCPFCELMVSRFWCFVKKAFKVMRALVIYCGRVEVPNSVEFRQNARRSLTGQERTSRRNVMFSSNFCRTILCESWNLIPCALIYCVQ